MCTSSSSRGPSTMPTTNDGGWSAADLVSTWLEIEVPKGERNHIVDLSDPLRLMLASLVVTATRALQTILWPPTLADSSWGCPSMLPLGRRAQERFSCEWRDGSMHAFASPDREACHLDIDNLVPVLAESVRLLLHHQAGRSPSQRKRLISRAGGDLSRRTQKKKKQK